MEKEFKSSSVEKKLNTKGCCFLCLIVIGTDDTSSELLRTKPLVSLKSLQRHFRINKTEEKKKFNPSLESRNEEVLPSPATGQDIKVELCNCCRRVVDKFKDAFVCLEKAQMEIDGWSERLYQQISEGSRKPEQAQIYSKRMTSDPKTLTQIVFADDLRKEIARKSKSLRIGAEAKIYIHQSKWKPKIEHFESLHEDTSDDQPWSPLEEDHYSNIGIDSPGEAQAYESSASSDTGEETGLPTIATIKQERDETDVSISYTRDSSPASSHSRSGGPNHEPCRDQMYVKNAETGSYNCTSCHKQFSEVMYVNKHYKEIHQGNRYPCDKCKRNFTDRSSLSRHKKTCNGVKKRRDFSHSNIKKYILNPKTGKYSCTACNKTFASKGNACTHYDAIHLIRKFKCEICNMALFSHPSSLAKHKKTCESTLKKRIQIKLATEKQPPSFKSSAL